jgi:hypothetical protein
MPIIIEQTHWEPIPTGNYPAKIVDLEEIDEQYGPQIKFTFELTPDDEGESRTIYGWCTRKFSPKSKLYGWMKAALGGGPIDRNYKFNSDDLIGRRVILSITEDQREDGLVNRISGVMPHNNQNEDQEDPFAPQDEPDW